MRTTREEMAVVRKHWAARAAAQTQALADARRAAGETNGDVTMSDSIGTNGAPAADGSQQQSPQGTPANAQASGTAQAPAAASTLPPPHVEGPRAWEYVDEILQMLKTSFPLLILSLETMVDQIQHKFKPNPEEDVYRTICMLMQDAIQVD